MMSTIQKHFRRMVLFFSFYKAKYNMSPLTCQKPCLFAEVWFVKQTKILLLMFKPFFPIQAIIVVYCTS